MKTHDGRFEFAEQIGGFGAEGRTSCPNGNALRINAELPVIRRKLRPPCRLALSVRRRRRVTEEVDVEWLTGLCSVRIAASSFRRASRLSVAQGNDPSPPAFDTATASAAPRTPAMGAWMIGSSMPNSSCRIIVVHQVRCDKTRRPRSEPCYPILFEPVIREQCTRLYRRCRTGSAPDTGSRRLKSPLKDFSDAFACADGGEGVHTGGRPTEARPA